MKLTFLIALLLANLNSWLSGTLLPLRLTLYDSYKAAAGGCQEALSSQRLLHETCTF